MNQQISDIFAQDQHHIWFASWDHGNVLGNVLSLDDGGTPADTSDDVWQTFPIGAVDGKLVVAVDALGRLWYGQASGLYRYNGSSWQLIYGGRPVCDLAPAADGTLYAQIVRSTRPPDAGSIRIRSWSCVPMERSRIHIQQVAHQRRTGHRATARRRNNLWTIASDGAIWYISHLDPGQELQRRSSSGLDTYALPVEPEAVQRLEVDARGHVWLVADSQLWRMEGPRAPVQQYLPMIRR